MSRVPLTDEEARAILAGEFASNLSSLERSEQEQVVSRLIDILENEAKPSALVHEQIGSLDIFTAGDQIRLYAKVVEGIPSSDAEYHVAYLFYIDDDHDYEQKKLATFSPAAEARMERVTSLTTVIDVEDYLKKHDALDADDFRDLLD